MPNFHEGKIVLLDKPQCDLDQYRNDMGELAICLPDGLEYQVIKVADELTELEKITSDYSSTFELNIDHRTKIMLGNIQYRITKGVSIFRALLLDGDMVVLDGFLRINSTIENMLPNTVSYSMQVIGTHQLWKEPLKDYCLQDLDLGTVLWDEAVLLNLMQNNGTYTDGGKTVYPMLADFGKFYNEKYLATKDVTIYDLRILVYNLPILKAMFNLVGYCVKSVFAESEYFRKEAIYALRDNFYDIENDGGDNLRTDAFAELSTDVLVPLPPSNPLYKIPFDNVLINNTGKYDGTTYKYTNNTNHVLDGVFVRLDLTICNYNLNSIIFIVNITMKNQFNTSVFFHTALQVDPLNPLLPNLPAGDCITLQETFDWSQILRDGLYNTGFIPVGYSLEINLSYGFEQPTILQGSSVEFLFGGNHWYEGDIIPIAKVLTCNATLYDYLLDWKTMYNLRFRTDEANKTVYIEPQPARYLAYETFELNAVIPSKYVKGFESGVQDPALVWDITDLIDICQAVEKQFESSNEFNAIKFKFKDTTDNHPNYEPYKLVGNELWSKLITLNNANVLKTLEISLKQIEPTLNDFLTRFSFDANFPIYVPIMWDSTPDASGEIPESGTSYETRIFHVFGWVSQMADNPNGGLISRRWTFEKITYVNVPTIAQALPPTMPIQPSFTPLFVVINNIFGDNVFNTYAKDLVTTFYPEALQQLKEGVELNLEIRLDTLTFNCVDISQMVRIFSERLPLIHLNEHYAIKKIVKSFGVYKHAVITLVPKLDCEA